MKIPPKQPTVIRPLDEPSTPAVAPQKSTALKVGDGFEAKTPGLRREEPTDFRGTFPTSGPVVTKPIEPTDFRGTFPTNNGGLPTRPNEPTDFRGTFPTSGPVVTKPNEPTDFRGNF